MNDHLAEPGGKVRLFVEAPLAQGGRVPATEGQAHYLLHVMRARAGERVSLFNGRDGEWLAQLTDVTKRGCAFECELQTRPQARTPDLWLCFAPIKKTPADYLTQKTTELGVSVLQPVVTRRTVVTRVNVERMRANAIEAAEQSDRLTVPEVRAPLPLEKLLSSWPAGRRILFCDEGGEAPPIAEALRPPSSGPWAVLTGPEGGFDPAERDAIRASPFVTPVSLGPRILRADTAALAALAIWQALTGDWR
ncbi:MAG TPA: 16S rRNA (uracil(1498)-N(3))-methyltransferase [Rhizomicrobium sp.]|jgi:16S rRNA (uracil1498-N3)-methyltransferase